MKKNTIRFTNNLDNHHPDLVPKLESNPILTPKRKEIIIDHSSRNANSVGSDPPDALFPSDSLEALGVSQGEITLNEALSETDIKYRYELGLGTLVTHNEEIFLMTHDHWGNLNTLGMVQFRNAAGEALLELDGNTFKGMIRYQDGGTMILGRSADGDPSDYIGAMIWSSKTKYGQTIQPVEICSNDVVGKGDRITVVRQGRDDSSAVELITASVESIEERWGQQVYKLRNSNNENIMPGDSGGGIWIGGNFIGNMWKSEFIYGWNWDSMTLEKLWTDTSFAAGSPEIVYLESQTETIEDVEPQLSEIDY